MHFLFPYVWHYVTDTYKDKLHHLIIDSLLSLVLLCVIIINLVLGYQFYVFMIPPEVTVTLQAPAATLSGAPVTVTLNYQNVTKPINQLTFNLQAPAGFVIDVKQPVVVQQLAAQQVGELPYTGTLTGTVGDSESFLVIYQYQYFGRTYYGFARASTKLAGSNFEVVAQAPDTILYNEPVDWKVDYTNSSDWPRYDTCLQLTFPNTFNIESSTKKINQKKRIRLKHIPARGSGSITIHGNFKHTIGEGEQLLDVVALDNCNDGDYKQVALTNPVTVLTPRFTLTTGGTGVVNVGQAARYVNTYKNTGDATLTNVTIITKLTNFVGHYSSIVASDGKVSGDIITWVDPSIAPGETHQRSFTVYTNPNLRKKNVAMSYTSSATAMIDDVGVATYVPAVSYNIKFNSTLNFTASYRYSSTTGEQFGYGPYPLEADNITALRVFWEIKDFTNDLTNVTIQATLPGQVEWTGLSSVTSGSDISYNPATRVVTWHTSRVPSFSTAQGASFEVRIRPNSAQIGKIINITNETSFSARDGFTATLLKRQVGALRVRDKIR